MKNFSEIGTTLSRDEAKKVVAGAGGLVTMLSTIALADEGNCSNFNCSCSGAGNPPYTTSWSGCYATTPDMVSAINAHCATSGKCTAA